MEKEDSYLLRLPILLNFSIILENNFEFPEKFHKKKGKIMIYNKVQLSMNEGKEKKGGGEKGKGERESIVTVHMTRD